MLRAVKIVSLLPSATEIVYALGLGEQLEGVTYECDFPADARTKTVVSGTALPTDRALTPSEIDDLVRESMAEQRPIYTLDADRIREIGPDLILAQDLCHVCAVPSGHVEEALDVLGCSAQVLSLDPPRLDDVLECIEIVGAATGTERRAREVTDALRARLEAVRASVAGRPRPRTLLLEWADPPFSGGHWIADMIDTSGGDAVLTKPGEMSRRITWEEIEASAPEIVIFSPCGYGLDDAVTQAGDLLDRPGLADARRVFAVDATSFFSRPGPRLVDGVEILAWALHPSAVAEPAAGGVRLLR